VEVVALAHTFHRAEEATAVLVAEAEAVPIMEILKCPVTFLDF
jgi:hypothetical protein